MSSKLQSQYPWTKLPLVANAAMAGFAGSSLATAVSSAGGIGFIGSANDMTALDKQLQTATLQTRDNNIRSSSPDILPLGVGFLLFAAKLHNAVDLVSRHKPAIIWLACPRDMADFALWTHALRLASPKSHVWIQTASVSSALNLAETCSPEVLIMQGSDAGGHGPCPGAGVISLVPETRDALDEAGFSSISIFASGGISDGRGVAAALACGADGVVLGTRFLASQEIDLPAADYQKAILNAQDGGKATVRGTVFDELKGKSIWPSQYDGRAILGASYAEFERGVDIEKIREKHAAAMTESHKGFGGDQRAAIWAGSGVGLVKEVLPAGEIVEQLRVGATKALKAAAERF